MHDTTAPQPLEVLIFEIEGQRYGLPAVDVQELLRAVAIAPLPKAPAVVEGVINLRGQIVPVFDIRQRFRLPPKPLGPADHFIVARTKERLVALRVDRALELVAVGAEALEEAKGAVPGVEYVAWVAKLPSDLVLIHDLRTFLSRAEGDALAQALSRPESDRAERRSP
jgi:purine-binding chemotaxis protein CheW